MIGRDVYGSAQANALATSFDWTKDTLAPTATITNEPASTSPDTALAITVGAAVSYRFVLNNQTTACSAESFTGAWIDVSVPISVSIGADGNKRLCVIGQDEAGNIQAADDATSYNWIKDTTSPTATIVAGAPAVQSTDTSIDVTVGGTDVVSYQYAFVTSSDACLTATYNGSWTSITTHITENLGADNFYRLCIIGRDAGSNSQAKASATQYDWTKDTTPPTVTLANTPENPSSDTTLSVTVGGAGVVEYKYALVTQPTSCVGATYSASWISVETLITDTIGADAAKSLCVLGRDVANNVQAEASATSYDWTKDTSAPTAVVTQAPTSPNALAAVDMVVGGTQVVDYIYSIIPQTGDCSGATYSAEWIPVATHITDTISSDGDKRLCVLGRDASSNAQLVATEIDWIQASSVANIKYTAAYTDDIVYRVTKNSQLVLRINPALATDYSFELGKPTAPELAAGATYQCPAPGSWTAAATPIELNFPSDGVFRLCLSIRNGSDTTYGPFHILKMGTATDYAAIVNALLAPDTSVNDAPGSATGALSVTLTPAGTNTLAYRYFMTQAATDCTAVGWSSYQAIADALVIDQTTLNDGLVNVCVRGVSQLWVQEAEATATKVSWMKDGTLQQVAIDTADLPAVPSRTTSFNVDITSAAYPKYKYFINEGSTCPVSTSFGSDTTISTQIALNVASLSDGPVTLCVKGVYAGGSVQASTTSYTWTKDTTAPTLTATEGYPIGATNDTAHAVSLTGAADYRFALIAGTTCPTDAPSYSAYATVINPINFDSSSIADGNVVLCLAGRDAAGNEQPLASATSYTWNKNTTASIATVTGAPTATSKVTTLSVDVAGTGVVNYYYNVVAGSSCGGSWTGPVAVTTDITSDISGLGDGTVSLCVKGEDNVGNVQISPTQKTWTKDTTAPNDVALTNVPSGTSNAVSVDITVSSSQATQYTYQITDTGGSCPASPSGSYTAVSNHISQSISGLNDGTLLLCVWGRDAALNVSTAVQRTWTKQMLACGGTPHGGTTSRTRYLTSSVAYGSTCTSESQTGTCYNGVLTWTGTYTNASCTVASPANCSVNGTAVNHGQSKTFYLASVASSCSSQSRTCTNGTMSGSTSYIYSTCRVYYNCTVGSTSVTHGQSKTFYSLSSSYSCSSYDQVRTCTDGTMSGSSTYSNATCSLPPCAGDRVGNACWYRATSPSQSCTTVCSSRGGCDATNLALATNQSTLCRDAIAAIGNTGGQNASGSFTWDGCISGLKTTSGQYYWTFDAGGNTSASCSYVPPAGTYPANSVSPYRVCSCNQ